MRAAEGIGEARPIQFDALEDLTALAHAHRCTGCVCLVTFRCGHVGGATPDRALGVDADAVRRNVLGPDAPACQ